MILLITVVLLNNSIFIDITYYNITDNITDKIINVKLL